MLHRHLASAGTQLQVITCGSIDIPAAAGDNKPAPGLVSCSDWLQGECRGGACPRPHPPFSLDEDLPWEQVKHPTVVLWEGAPMYGTAGAAGSATQQAQQGSDSWRAGGWDRGRGPVGSDSVAAAASPRSLEAAGGASAETAAQSAGDFAAAEAGQYGPGGGDEEHVSMLQVLKDRSTPGRVMYWSLAAVCLHWLVLGVWVWGGLLLCLSVALLCAGNILVAVLL